MHGTENPMPYVAILEEKENPMHVASSAGLQLADLWSSANSATTGTQSYRSLSDLNDTLVAHGQQYTREYAAEYASAEDGGIWSTDQVLSALKTDFPTYDIVSSEPKDVVKGRNLLYIDSTNLSKMATDSDYRARVMGLIKRESEGLSTARIGQGDQTFTFHPTGSIFSLSESNPKVDGIPYQGSAESEGFSTTTSSSGGTRDLFSASGTTSPRQTIKTLLEEAIAKQQEKRTEEKQQAAEEQATKNRAATAAANGGVDLLV
jgi:hypothetical protein